MRACSHSALNIIKKKIGKKPRETRNMYIILWGEEDAIKKYYPFGNCIAIYYIYIWVKCHVHFHTNEKEKQTSIEARIHQKSFYLYSKGCKFIKTNLSFLLLQFRQCYGSRINWWEHTKGAALRWNVLARRIQRR